MQARGDVYSGTADGRDTPSRAMMSQAAHPPPDPAHTRFISHSGPDTYQRGAAPPSTGGVTLNRSLQDYAGEMWGDSAARRVEFPGVPAPSAPPQDGAPEPFAHSAVKEAQSESASFLMSMMASGPVIPGSAKLSPALSLANDERCPASTTYTEDTGWGGPSSTDRSAISGRSPAYELSARPPPRSPRSLPFSPDCPVTPSTPSPGAGAHYLSYEQVGEQHTSPARSLAARDEQVRHPPESSPEPQVSHAPRSASAYNALGVSDGDERWRAPQLAGQLTLETYSDKYVCNSEGEPPFRVMATIRCGATTEDAAELSEDVLGSSSRGRAGIDVVALVDRSSSMAGKPIELVKQTLRFMVTQLDERDRLSVITFHREVDVAVPLMPMDGAGKGRAVDAIAQLQTGRMTNISGALQRAVQMLSSNDLRRVTSVLLLTDGLPTMGLRKTSEMLSILRSGAKKCGQQYTINTFGFANNHDSAMLRSIADLGKGVYYYVEHAHQVPAAFADCLGGLMSVSAQNIVLTCRAMREVSIERVITTCFAKEHSRGQLYSVEIGDIQQGERRDVVFEVSKTGSGCNVVEFDVTYDEVYSGASLRESALVVVVTGGSLGRRVEHPRAIKLPERQKISEEIEIQHNRVRTAAVLRRAQQLVSASRFDDARAALADTLRKLEASSRRDLPSIAGFRQALSSFLESLNKSTESFMSDEAYRMASYGSAQCNQRGGYQCPEYETEARRNTRSAYGPLEEDLGPTG